MEEYFGMNPQSSEQDKKDDEKNDQISSGQAIYLEYLQQKEKEEANR